MLKIVEGDLVFNFGSNWRVVKYDDHSDYKNKIMRFQGCKAVDFVALYTEKSIWFIEAKDFRGYPANNKRRVTSGELANEIALKVRDTLAGILGARQTSSTPREWHPFIRTLNIDRSVFVVLWLEQDFLYDPGYASALGERIKANLRWLTPRVIVASTRSNAPPELLVTYRAGGIRR